MSIEDFSTYTEVDGTGVLTVTSSKITGLNVDKDIDAYVYKDFTANHFNRLKVYFEVNIESGSDVGGIGYMGFSDTVGTKAAWEATSLIAGMAKVGGPLYKVILIRGNSVASDNYTGSADTLYYCTIVRAAGSDSATLLVYDDAPRTNLLDTLAVAGYGANKWQYAYGFVNTNEAQAAENFSGYIQDLQLFSVVSVASMYYSMMGIK